MDLLINIALSLLAGAALAIAITGVITLVKLKEELKERGCEKVIIEWVDRTENKVSFKDLKKDITGTIQGDGISSDIYKGQLIYV